MFSVSLVNRNSPMLFVDMHLPQPIYYYFLAVAREFLLTHGKLSLLQLKYGAHWQKPILYARRGT